MKSVILALTSVALATACTKKEPEVAAAPAQATPATRSTSITVDYVEPPDDLFVEMIVAASAWARRSLGARSIGVYQADAADRRFRIAVEEATRRYSFRPIRQSDFTVVCSGNDRAPTVKSSPTGVCSMKFVDAVMMFNSVRMKGDSGFVGLNITRVPSGATRSEQTHYCVTVLRNGTAWEAKRGERMVDWNRCQQPIR